MGSCMVYLCPPRLIRSVPTACEYPSPTSAARIVLGPSASRKPAHTAASRLAFPPRPLLEAQSCPPDMVGSSPADSGQLCYWTRPGDFAPVPHSPSPLQLCLPARFVSVVRTRSKHVTLTSLTRVVFQRRYQDHGSLPRRRTAKTGFCEYFAYLWEL